VEGQAHTSSATQNKQCWFDRSLGNPRWWWRRASHLVASRWCGKQKDPCPRSSALSNIWAVIKCIYLPPTYLHFMQDIEDRCILLTSSMSFVDLPFQEHQMTKKHHIDQNTCISSLCSKPGVVSDNMTQGDDVAESPSPTDPRWGWPARVWLQ
jgi:hypothetical protein